jgi:hypothetical protein
VAPVHDARVHGVVELIRVISVGSGVQNLLVILL